MMVTVFYAFQLCFFMILLLSISIFLIFVCVFYQLLRKSFIIIIHLSFPWFYQFLLYISEVMLSAYSFRIVNISNKLYFLSLQYPSLSLQYCFLLFNLLCVILIWLFQLSFLLLTVLHPKILKIYLKKGICLDFIICNHLKTFVLRRLVHLYLITFIDIFGLNPLCFRVSICAVGSMFLFSPCCFSFGVIIFIILL